MTRQKDTVLIINAAGVRGSRPDTIERQTKYLPYSSKDLDIPGYVDFLVKGNGGEPLCHLARHFIKGAPFAPDTPGGENEWSFTSAW